MLIKSSRLSKVDLNPLKRTKNNVKWLKISLIMELKTTSILYHDRKMQGNDCIRD